MARKEPEATRAELSRRLGEGPRLVLDGATGTELERRGAYAGLPLWSAHALLDAPELVERIHRDYVEAGAEILTANTFRTQRRTLAHAGLGERAAELTAQAVELARRAAATTERQVWIAGSMPPLEDCYRPERVPEDEALREEHAEHARHLVAAGVDLLLVETMNTVREAQRALAAAVATGVPALVSFVVGEEARLLSGEPLEEALEAVRPLGPLAVLVNCAPPSAIEAAAERLARSGLAFGLYPNLGAPVDREGRHRSEEMTPAQFAAYLARWIERGARVVGGCCGTTPAHIAALAGRARR